MKQLSEYRTLLLERLERSAREFRAAVLSVGDAAAPLNGGWNAHQLAVHARDVEKFVYGARIRRSLSEDDPLFENFDGDAWMASHYDPNEPLAYVLDELAASVSQTVASLKDLDGQGWNRPSQHQTYGSGFTTQTWAERSLAHIEEHLATVRKDGRE
jgi:hypothetical protein